jgi:poly-D-alanine transfer protein DltD
MKIKLTESKLKQIVKEAVYNIMESNQEEMRKYAQEDNQIHMGLQNYLQKMGVESAKLSQFPSGAYYVGVYTPEYNDKQVYKIVDNYANRLGMIYNDDQYPATTQISLRKY